MGEHKVVIMFHLWVFPWQGSQTAAAQTCLILSDTNVPFTFKGNSFPIHWTYYTFSKSQGLPCVQTFQKLCLVLGNFMLLFREPDHCPVSIVAGRRRLFVVFTTIKCAHILLIITGISRKAHVAQVPLVIIILLESLPYLWVPFLCLKLNGVFLMSLQESSPWYLHIAEGTAFGFTDQLLLYLYLFLIFVYFICNDAGNRKVKTTFEFQYSFLSKQFIPLLLSLIYSVVCFLVAQVKCSVFFFSVALIS